MYPKLVALDTDWTIFWGCLDVNKWGKGWDAYQNVEDNIGKVNHLEIQDRSNGDLRCGMYADIPRIIGDILKQGAKLAIVSRNTSKAMCDRALWYWMVQDARGNKKHLIELVEFDEVYDLDKTVHFNKIKGWTGFNFSDMILYDDEAINNTVEMMLGVTFQVSRDQKGLTWDNYQQGLDMWRRNNAIQSPWRGLNLNAYPKRKLLGYSGMDIDTIKLLEAGGRRHDRIEPARWGYAMYVADDPAIAEYFSDWIKHPAFGPQAETIVCAIYARDEDIWRKLNKIWIPDRLTLQTDVNSGDEFQIAWSQEDRDRLVVSWGVQKPYVLFARHPNMGGKFPVPVPLRWNELVIYGNIQESLIVIERMSDQTVLNAMHIHYEWKIREWGITVPGDTWGDFLIHGETNFR